MFPFNNIEEDNELLASFNNIDKLGFMDVDVIFHPFEINEYDTDSPICDIRPDLFSYNGIDMKDTNHCNCFGEKVIG